MRPLWNDPSTRILIHGGCTLPTIPRNARIIGVPRYLTGLDASLYDMDQRGLQTAHERTMQKNDEHARETAAELDIPIGQQVHAFRELYERLYPRRGRRASGAPILNAYLDEVMPRIGKRRRERHLKCFALVTSEDWPTIQAFCEAEKIEITGMDSILKIAAEHLTPSRPKPKRTRTPLRERYASLRSAVINRRYADARRIVLTYDEEDADADEGSYIEDAADAE